MKPALVVVILLLASPGLADSTSEHLKRGLIAANTGDYATALEECKPLASRGNAVAQNNVGMMYQSGHGIQTGPPSRDRLVLQGGRPEVC